MKTKLMQWLGIALALEMAFVHAYTAPSEFEEGTLWGVLFLINAGLSLVAALGILRASRLGWLLALGVALGSFGGYIYSRTLGLPGMEVEEWFLPAGIISLVVEGLLIPLAVWHLIPRRPTAEALPPGDSARYTLPAAALSLVVVVALFTVMWTNLTSVPMHDSAAHAAVLLTQQDLRDQYGLQVNLVGVSAMGSIIDIRFRILDVEKAKSLLDNPELMPMLMVNDAGVQIMPTHMHTHRFTPGGTYIMFYPNQNGAVRTGTAVNLMFGNMELEPVIAQ